MTTYAAAHIITAEAEAMGDPEVIVMTRDDGMGADEIERHPIFGGDDYDAARRHLDDLGWRVTGEPTYAGTGYVILDVVTA